jgi:hypothetical protein
MGAFVGKKGKEPDPMNIAPSEQGALIYPKPWGEIATRQTLNQNKKHDFG